MMLIGYACVSNDDPKLEVQHKALQQVGCDRTYYDKVGGAKAERPELSKALAFCREGDTLVVWRLDCLGRPLHSVAHLLEMLEWRKVDFYSIQEGIDTRTGNRKLILQLFEAAALLQHNLIRERTSAGLKAARAKKRMNKRTQVDVSVS